MILLKLIGLLGGAGFAFAAVPTALKTWRAGKSQGTPVSIAWAIFVGCICLFTYLTAMHGLDWVLVAVYGVETTSWAVLLRYHYFPRFGGWSCRRVQRAHREAAAATARRDYNTRNNYTDS